ncbi:MAG: HD domain-containing protein [Candidatus Gastranaerophilales bacterium]|nr:HD domain-containing protein [Candidatus Gastranaerophilales bacterium]
MNMNYDDILDLEPVKVLACLAGKEAKLFLAGGFLRDKLCAKESFDMDFIVQGQNALELAEKFAQKIGGSFVLLDKDYEIARVVADDKLHYFDFARCLGDDIEKDLKRRDLTVNSIALEIFPSVKLYDINKGIEDFHDKKIKVISEQNIIDDPLRILRVFRFAVQLGFKIDPETLKYAKKHLDLIDSVSKERILAEFLKLLEAKNSAKYVEFMYDIGLLYKILPILEIEEGIPPNSHHHLDLIHHSMETLRQAEYLIEEMPEWVSARFDENFNHALKVSSLFKVACLLHDIGKRETWTIEENGRHRFINHDEVGAMLLKPVLKQLKFSKAQTAYVTKLVRYHIYPSQLTRSEEAASQKAINRMFRKLDNETIDVIILAMADRFSALGPEITKQISEDNFNALTIFLNQYKAFAQTKEPLPKLLDGNEIAEFLNIPRGKELGRIIKELQEAQACGEVLSKKDALNFLKNIVN